MPDKQFPIEEQQRRFGFVWDEIGGFGDFMDFWSHYAKVVEHAPPRSMLIEVGSFQGRSTCCLGLLAKEANKELLVYAIDDSTIGGNPHLKANLKKAGLGAHVTIIEMSSVDATDAFKNGEAWWIFLDDDHRHEAVEAGIRAWKPKLTADGWLCGHDLTWHTVAQPLHAMFGVENVITEHDDVWVVSAKTPIRESYNIYAESYRQTPIPDSWKP